MQPSSTRDPGATTATWRSVHHIVGPPAGRPETSGLYVHGAAPGPVTQTPAGPRHGIVVPSNGLADLGGWSNAFPAGEWRAHVGALAVRLLIRVDAVAVLTVHRSDAEGAPTVVEKRLLSPGAQTTVEVAIADSAAGGFVWFDLRAGAVPVTVEDAAWQVREAPRAGGVVIGTPTTGRAADVAANLRRIVEAGALRRLVERIVVVDHAAEPIESAVLGAAGPLPAGLVHILRQPNLGGSGGFSRAMHEALTVPGAQAVLLLDDDIVVEPAALVRAIEFGRRTIGGGLVGLQMLDADRPTVVEAGAERIVDRTFWWSSADPGLPGTDVAGAPVVDLPALHRRTEADFAGWWACLVPLDVVRAIGYAMPFFLKWDDAEYALRAREAGFGTVSLTGAAVWHESWRGKDDSRSWPAFFHARNRVLAALLHGDRRVRSGVLLDGLLLEVKQLLALQTFAVARRHEGLRAVLEGPDALAAASCDGIDRLRELAADAPDQRRIPATEVGEALRARPRTPSPRRAPTGLALAVWAALQTLRHLLPAAVSRSAQPGRLDAGGGTWWVLPSYDDVLAPTADGAAFFRLRRDPRRFRALLAASLRLHLRLWIAWPALERRYRRAAPELSSGEAWQRRFATPTGR